MLPSSSKKNRNLKKSVVSGFDFNYADVAQVFIIKRFSYYEIVCIGFIYLSGAVCFSKNAHYRHKCDNLYQAVFGFNNIVTDIVKSMDWFDEHWCNSIEQLEFSEATERIRKRVYKI